MERDGYIVDNPKVGPTLTEEFWSPGNSQPFLSLVEKCTGKPLTGDAWISELEKDVSSLLVEEKEAYDKARAEVVGNNDDIDLDMRIRIVDGDNVLADTDEDGSFLATCQKFENYVRENYSTAV